MTDEPYTNPPSVDVNTADDSFDYSDEDRIRDIAEGDIERGLSGASRAHLALAFVRVCQRMGL